MPFVGHLPELIVVLVIGLLFFGPKRLPEMGNAVGKTIKEFQRTFKSGTEEATPATPTVSSVPTAIPTTAESTATIAHPVSTTETIVEAPTHVA